VTWAIVAGILGVLALAQAESWAQEHYERCKVRDAKLEKQARLARIAAQRGAIVRERDARASEALAREARLKRESDPAWIAEEQRRAQEYANRQSQLQNSVFGMSQAQQDTGTGAYHDVEMANVFGGTELRRVWIPHEY
jgi:hypothetical protein